MPIFLPSRRLLLASLLLTPGLEAQQGPSGAPPHRQPAAVPSPQAAGAPTTGPLAAAQNPYQLTPFHPDYPVELSYPPHHGQDYDRTRRQMLQQVAANLAGGGRREAWQAATEFFWRAPEDAIEPLTEAMDRAAANAALGDVVKNCVDAMGMMASPAFDGALRRALQHKNPVVVQAAFAALGTAGKPETLRELAPAFVQMEGRARGAWLRAVRLRLPAEAVNYFRAIMNDPRFTTAVRDQVLQETLKLPPEQAAEVLRGRWQEAIGEFKAIIAGVLHAAGDGSGTAWLQRALDAEDMTQLTHAIKHCGFGDVGMLREPLLRASTHGRPEIRLEVAKTLTRLEGEDVADVYEVLAGADEPWEIRGIALRELHRRGRHQIVSVLLDEVPTATGVRLQGLLSQLSASGDPRAVPVLLERWHKAPEAEGRPFLQALAQNQSEAAAKALLEVFRGPERVVQRSSSSGALTTRTYLPTLLLNLRGSERLVLAAFTNLPRSEWQLRALLLPTLVGFASDRQDEALQRECIELARRVLFDREEIPQNRVLALNLLSRRWLTIDDAVRLKQSRSQESAGMRLLFTDFLHDMF
jgi:hypothetical protein